MFKSVYNVKIRDITFSQSITEVRLFNKIEKFFDNVGVRYDIHSIRFLGAPPASSSAVPLADGRWGNVMTTGVSPDNVSVLLFCSFVNLKKDI